MRMQPLVDHMAGDAPRVPRPLREKNRLHLGAEKLKVQDHRRARIGSSPGAELAGAPPCAGAPFCDPAGCAINPNNTKTMHAIVRTMMSLLNSVPPTSQSAIYSKANAGEDNPPKPPSQSECPAEVSATGTPVAPALLPVLLVFLRP